MKHYVSIRTAYSSQNELTEQNMSAVYENETLLKELISDVISSNLSIDKIAGKKVLLKPNWVRDNREPKHDICLRTHDKFLLVALDLLLDMKPSRVVLGDAPVQGCQWNNMITESFLCKVDRISIKHNIPVLVKDFRRTVYNAHTNSLEQNKSSLDEFIIFDVGEKSFLEDVSDDSRSPFRVTSYDPSRLAETHRKGMHKYCITKELFDADVVITVPKIKTHQKAGLTNALKILVGVNGDKDFLPHHRKGSLEQGGDCYPGKSPLRDMSESVLDYANTKIGTSLYKPLLHFAAILWKISNPNKEQNAAAGWYGNDTTWRMVLDINQVVLYGNADGTLSDTVQRELYSLCDGIIGGQGNGPLSPDPLPLGVVAFSNNSALMDIVAGSIMGMNIDKIPLLKNASKWIENKSFSINLNNRDIDIKDLKSISVKAIMPPGWMNYDIHQ